MSDDRKYYRTAPYRVVRDGQEHIMFWAIIPSGLDAAKSFVTEHDLYQGGASSKPVMDQVPDREAVKCIAGIDRDAAAKYPLADEKEFMSHLFIGDSSRNALHWTEHPEHRKGQTDEVIQRLRSRKPPKFGLKL